MIRFLISLWLFLIGASLAYAQSPVTTNPAGVNSGNYSSAISVTNTFQSVLAASTSTSGRRGCIIQNNGAATMYIYFGAPASATTNNSLSLAAGTKFNCENGVTVIKDQISITGTATQRFFAVQY